MSSCSTSARSRCRHHICLPEIVDAEMPCARYRPDSPRWQLCQRSISLVSALARKPGYFTIRSTSGSWSKIATSVDVSITPGQAVLVIAENFVGSTRVEHWQPGTVAVDFHHVLGQILDRLVLA